VKVWVTPTYPDYNWTAHPGLDATFGAGFVDRLQAALVGMDDPGLLAAAGRPEGIIPASNADFEPLDALAEALGLLR
jgi:phosphonate transport system substrate-binding protein